jgi:hypothetical protein
VQAPVYGSLHIVRQKGVTMGDLSAAQFLPDERVKTVIGNLQKRNVSAQYVSSRQEVLTIILE